jgi:hypothetical protein
MGRPPSRVLPLVGTVALVALAAGGWSLFSQPSQGVQPYTLAGDQAQMALPEVRSVTAEPAAPQGGTRRSAPDAVSAARVPRSVEGTDLSSLPELLPPPRVPTVVVPRSHTGGEKSDLASGLPELLPKTTEQLGRIVDSAAGLASSLRGTDRKITELNWPAVAKCASRNDPKSAGPDGTYGLYRLTPEDWESVGGVGLPSEATPEEQTRRAQLLYAREDGRWQTLWPKCGRLLF